MLVNGIGAVDLNAAEIMFCVMRMDSGTGFQEKRSRAFRFYTRCSGSGGNPESSGNSRVRGPADGGTFFQKRSVQEQVRLVENSANRDSEKRFALVEIMGNRTEVGNIDPRGLKRSDQSRAVAGPKKIVFRLNLRGIDRAKIAHLPTGKAGVGRKRSRISEFPKAFFGIFGKGTSDHRIEADFHARIAPVFIVGGEIKSRFAKLFLGTEQLIKLCARSCFAVDNGGVVRSTSLRIFGEPVSGFCVHHLAVIRRKKTERR